MLFVCGPGSGRSIVMHRTAFIVLLPVKTPTTSCFYFSGGPNTTQLPAGKRNKRNDWIWQEINSEVFHYSGEGGKRSWVYFYFSPLLINDCLACCSWGCCLGLTVSIVSFFSWAIEKVFMLRDSGNAIHVLSSHVFSRYLQGDSWTRQLPSILTGSLSDTKDSAFTCTLSSSCLWKVIVLKCSHGSGNQTRQ